MNSVIRFYFVAEGLENGELLGKMLYLITHKNIELTKVNNGYRVSEVSVNDFTKIAASVESLSQDLDLRALEIVVVPFYDDKLINSVKKIKTGVYFLYDILVEQYYHNELNIHEVTSILADVPEEILITVKNYIRLNQSLSQTGELMFAHRNTINYRVNRFISLTSINVREMQNAVLVYFILMLMDIK